MATNSPSISKYQIRQIILYLSCFYFLFLMPCYGDVDAGTDTLLQGQQLRDGEYLSSANKIFRLEFFSSGPSQSKFLGIFYNQEYRPHPVWVANRNNPVPNLFVMLMIDTTDGLLKISYRGGNTTISNSTPSAKNTSATILDNGNLVLRMLKPDGSINRTLWQSFDYPTDTLVPGMKLGINFRKGHNWSITSWISDEVPASGSFTLGGDPKGSSQLVMWWKGSVYWTSGLTYSVHGNISFASLFILSNGGITTTFQESEYQVTAASFDACSISGNLAPGCVMDMSPKCRNADDQFRGRRGFVENFGYIYENQNLSLLDCKAQCWQNCSCIGFTFANINGSSCRILNKATSFSPSEEYGEVVYFLDTGRG